MIKRKIFYFVPIVAILAFLRPFPASASEPCEAWMASLRDYDDAFERVMQGEPEDLLQYVKQAREPGRKAAAKKAAEAKLSGLRDIDPPPELSTVHGHLTAYAQAVVKAVAAAKPADAGSDGPAMRPCYETLLDYYLTLRDLMREHNCHGGDLDALENKIIPRLEELLNQAEHEGAQVGE